MIKSLEVNKFVSTVVLNPSGIGGNPLYIFLANNKKKILYTDDLLALLGHAEVHSSLYIDNENISQLLQCGVVPPPNTVYKNLFLLGIGDTATVSQYQKSLVIKFQHEFVYTEEKLKKTNNHIFQEDVLFEKLASATRSKADMSKKINLFHTAGKDSNMIALALSRYFEPEQLRFVCHESDGDSDESKISREVAKKLNVEHLTIKADLELTEEYLTHLREYFRNAPFPLLDNVTMAFPEYVMNYPDLNDSNIVIGDGNDTYMMSPPSLRDEIGILINKHFNTKPLARFVGSENPLVQLCRTPFEWARMSGFNNEDSYSLYDGFVSVNEHWYKMRDEYRSSSALDIKSHSYACFIIYEVYLRKFRNYSSHINSNLIMPFFDPAVADEILKYDKSLIIDKRSRKNKPIFRDVIKKHLDVDSDAIGKKGYTLNTVKFIYENRKWISIQILECSLWNRPAAENILDRLYASTKSKGWRSSSAARLIHRLLLISLWFNNSKYIKNAT